MQQSDVYYQQFLNMFRASLYPSSGEQRPCVTACGVLRWFCWMWLVAVVGRCADIVDNKHLIVASCWFSLSLSSHFAHDARSQELKPSELISF